MGLLRRKQHEPAAGWSPPASEPAPVAGPVTWARQVLAALAPPPPGFVKRSSCAVCGAPKKLPSVTAYVYCDYCASLIDFDLRQASLSASPYASAGVGPARS